MRNDFSSSLLFFPFISLTAAVSWFAICMSFHCSVGNRFSCDEPNQCKTEATTFMRYRDIDLVGRDFRFLNLFVSFWFDIEFESPVRLWKYFSLIWERVPRALLPIVFDINRVKIDDCEWCAAKKRENWQWPWLSSKVIRIKIGSHPRDDASIPLHWLSHRSHAGERMALSPFTRRCARYHAYGRTIPAVNWSRDYHRNDFVKYEIRVGHWSVCTFESGFRMFGQKNKSKYFCCRRLHCDNAIVDMPASRPNIAHNNSHTHRYARLRLFSVIQSSNGASPNNT